VSDKTAAHAFAVMFEALASDEFMFTVPDFTLRAAKKVWDQMAGFDFSPHQMHCDDALVKLGLARHVRDPYCPGQTVIKYEGRR